MYSQLQADLCFKDTDGQYCYSKRQSLDSCEGCHYRQTMAQLKWTLNREGDIAKKLYKLYMRNLNIANTYQCKDNSIQA